MEDLEGIFQVWKNAREQDTAPSQNSNIRYSESLSTNVREEAPVPSNFKAPAPPPDPMPSIIPALFTDKLMEAACVPSTSPTTPPAVIASTTDHRMKPSGLCSEASAKASSSPISIIKAEECTESPVTTAMDSSRELDVQQIATIVRVANRQRGDNAAVAVEKAKKKKEKQQILLYGRFYKCKLQIRALQREILNACDKHNELLAQLTSLAKRANIPADETQTDLTHLSRRIQMICSACIKQEPKARKVKSGHLRNES